MSIKTIKLFRTISKIFLILIGVGLVGYLGYLGYISYKFPPYKVTVSNITDSSFTVSWVTDVPTRGYVYYKEKDSFLPGLLGWINSGVAYDDRDWAYNQSVCVNEFNANSEVDDTFTVVNSDNFDCEDIKVKNIESFYTHHVTLKNLDAEKEYYFRVGNGFWGWKTEEYSSSTFSLLTDILEPAPVFGRVVITDDLTSYDSIIYGKFLNYGNEKESVLYSSVTNDDGGWYLDASGARDEEGELVDLERGEDMFRVVAQILNLPLSSSYEWIFESLDGAYPDIILEEDFDIVIEEGVKGVADSNIPDEGGEVLSIWDFVLPAPIQTIVNTVKSTVTGIKAVANTVSSIVNKSPAASTAATTPTYQSLTPTVKSSTVGLGTVQATVTHKSTPLGTAPTSPSFTTPQISLSSIPSLSNNNLTSSTQNQTTNKTLTAEDINKLSDQEVRAEICPSCPSYVTAKQIREIATSNDTAFIAGMTKVIGAGNVGRIVAGTSENGVLGIPELQKMGLPTNNATAIVGNLNALSRCNGPQGSENACMKAEKVQEMLDNQDWDSLATLGIQIDKSKTDNDGSLWTNPRNIKVETKFTPPDGDVPTGIVTHAQVRATQDKVEDKTKGLIFSNAEWVGPLRFSSEFGAPDTLKLEITNSKDQQEVPDLVYNSATGNYEVGSIKGLGQYLSASVFETKKTALEYMNEGKLKIPGFRFGPLSLLNPRIEETEEGSSFSLNIKAPVGLIEVGNEGMLGIIVDTILKNTTPQENPHLENVEVKGATDQEALEMMTQLCFKVSETGCSTGINIIPIKIDSTDSNSLESLLGRFRFKAYAEVTENDDFLYYASEDGIFDLSVNGVKVSQDMNIASNDLIMLYVEGNGQEGFQAPKDWLDPKDGEDRIVSTSSVAIETEKKSSDMTIELKEGINIIGVDAMPISTGNEILTARKLVGLYPDDIQFVAEYSAGRWSNIVRADIDSSNGMDFPIIPGKGYLISSNYDIDIKIPVKKLVNSVPLYLSAGWNLVGIHGYTKAFTARSLIDSINGVEGLTADNVSWWPTSKGKYEGLQVTAGTSYGLDFPISPKNGYFVRINKFEPSSSDCNSIIWQEGADAHGKCGTNNL